MEENKVKNRYIIPETFVVSLACEAFVAVSGNGGFEDFNHDTFKY